MSKQRLIYSTFILFGVLLGMGLGIGRATGKDQHGYILRYYADVPTYGTEKNFVTFSASGLSQWWPQQPTRKEERSEWFTSLEEAQRRLNGGQGCTVGGYDWITTGSVSNFCAIAKEDFIGLYRAEEIAVSQVKVGSEKKLIQKTEEVEVDKLEWRVRP